MSTPENPTIARREQLLRERKRLEFLITNTVDEKLVATLRADYRNVVNELELYYDDIPSQQQS